MGNGFRSANDADTTDDWLFPELYLRQYGALLWYQDRANNKGTNVTVMPHVNACGGGFEARCKIAPMFLCNKPVKRCWLTVWLTRDSGSILDKSLTGSKLILIESCVKHKWKKRTLRAA